MHSTFLDCVSSSAQQWSLQTVKGPTLPHRNSPSLNVIRIPNINLPTTCEWMLLECSPNSSNQLVFVDADGLFVDVNMFCWGLSYFGRAQESRFTSPVSTSAEPGHTPSKFSAKSTRKECSLGCNSPLPQPRLIILWLFAHWSGAKGSTKSL